MFEYEGFGAVSEKPNFLDRHSPASQVDGRGVTAAVAPPWSASHGFFKAVHVEITGETLTAARVSCHAATSRLWWRNRHGSNHSVSAPGSEAVFVVHHHKESPYEIAADPSMLVAMCLVGHSRLGHRPGFAKEAKARATAIASTHDQRGSSRHEGHSVL